MTADLELKAGGLMFSGWTSVSFTRSMEQLAHSFNVAMTNTRKDGLHNRVDIHKGDSFAISYKNKQLTEGWIDSDPKAYTENSSSIGFSGRSLTGDLVDCAAIYKGGQWRKKKLLKIAKDLIDPFGLKVSTNVDLGEAFKLFELEDGETVFNTLERAARRRGVLLLTKPDGNLLFDRVGSKKVKTVLERGVNIKAGSRNGSWSNRFSKYIIKAQIQGDDETSGEAASSITRTSLDSTIDRYRPTILSAEDEDSGRELKKRADWERNIRIGRGEKFNFTVHGWEHSDGLWEPNTLVQVRDDFLGIRDELLIVETAMNRDEQTGTTTKLSLMVPNAMSVQPTPPPKPKG